jgi:hypothetical protein
MHQQSWFDMLFSKYIPFMVRDRFAYSVKPLQNPELERFEGNHHTPIVSYFFLFCLLIPIIATIIR